MNINRGLIAAFTCSSIGAVSTVFLIAVFAVGNWFFNDTTPAEREFDIRWLATAWIVPSIGVSIYLGLTAFTTYSARTNYGFARTLAIIFFVSIPLTSILGTLELTPKRVKSNEHPILYPSELAILLLPPSVVAALLLASRVNIASNDISTIKKTEPSDAHQALGRPF